MFTGPGKVNYGEIAALPRTQSINELTENLMMYIQSYLAAVLQN